VLISIWVFVLPILVLGRGELGNLRHAANGTRRRQCHPITGSVRPMEMEGRMVHLVKHGGIKERKKKGGTKK